MLGLMQSHNLLISSLITNAERHHGEVEIVSRRVEGDVHRTTWAGIAQRSRQIANALTGESLTFSDRVATLAWNGYRHLEMYFGVSGSGHVLHTLNPRLHPEQLAWIINHAEDKIVAFDMSFLPLVQAVQAKCPTVQNWVAMCDASALPADSGVPNLVAYEAWMGQQSDVYEWPDFDENSASSMCYTSGTTGNPKGVVYSHRSTLLHAWAAALPDALNISSRDTILPVVPMFHANAWAVPYSAAAIGTKLVFPGPAMDGKSVYDLIESEGVTMSAGVPTVWQMMLAHMESNKLSFSTMNRTVIGGSACPPAMIDAFNQRYNVDVLHAWGMTEMSPLGTVCTLKGHQSGLSAEAKRAIRLKQGRVVFGVDMKIVDPETGASLPWDGVTFGDLLVKGPWVTNGYFKLDNSSLLMDGWFHTGDVGTIDPQGFLQITDRSKDVIKSGGEWISSIEIENIAVGHPKVELAAVIGAAHPKWDERPVLLLKLKEGETLDKQEHLDFLQGKIAKWWMPDDVVFVDDIPLGATGKIDKKVVRERLKDYRLPA